MTPESFRHDVVRVVLGAALGGLTSAAFLTFVVIRRLDVIEYRIAAVERTIDRIAPPSIPSPPR